MKKAGCTLLLSALIILNLQAEEETLAQWQKRKESVMKDASAARHYTFENVKDSSSIVKDLKGSGADLAFVPFVSGKEKIDDLQVIEGRWPGKTAVRLDKGWYQGPVADIQNNSFSVEVWFRRNGPGTHKHSFTGSKERSDGSIIATANGYGLGWRLVTVYNQRQSLEFFLGGSRPSSAARAYSYLSVPDGVWHHLAATWNGSEMKLYLNGIPAGSQKYQGPYVPSVAGDFLKIGYIRAGVGSVILDVDEVVIYNRVLTPVEIEKLGKAQTEGLAGILRSADSLMESGMYRQARDEYEKLKNAAGIDYGKPLAMLNIAESYRKEKDYPSSHKVYGEIMKLEGLSPYYRIYALSRQAEVYAEQKDYTRARRAYSEIQGIPGSLAHHVFTARLNTGDTYRNEKKYSAARSIYQGLLIEQEASSHPHEVYRLELRNRLEAIEGLSDGVQEKKKLNLRLAEMTGSPSRVFYVSPGGRDTGTGTKESPFATIRKAQEEVRRTKEKGMPKGGIAVCLREGNYFLNEPVIFEKEDSGLEDAPVVYKSFPGEKVRLIGGKEVKNFKPSTDPETLKKIPEEARASVWEADLKSLGINNYGQLLNRGGHNPPTVARPGALEVIFNGRVMTLSRWPNSGYERIAGLPGPREDGIFRNKPFQRNRFVYSGDRPKRWTEEKEVWIKGYLAETMPFQMIHVKMTKLDTEKRIIETAPDTRWGDTYSLYNTPYQQSGPYYAYNLLSELDSPGEWYLDRDTGKLYFWPPEDIIKNEVVVTTFDKPVVSFNNASNIALAGVTVEGTWTHGIDIQGGRNVIVSGNTIRNTGQYAVNIKGGWNHVIFGCDMYDMGEGGAIIDAGDQKKLIPSGHLLENNHIYRFNRFCGGYRPAALLMGIGHRLSHNLIHDAPMHAIYMHGASQGSSSNDHVIEFNEFHDVPYEAREFGAIYIYTDLWHQMNRGNVIRNNFFHHISYHSSPNMSQGLNAIHIDSLNGGFAVTDNFFYRVPNGISNPQPDNRLENNIFIEAESRAISQGNRAYLVNDIDTGKPFPDRIERFTRQLLAVNYQQPPWSHRYPQLTEALSGKKMVGWSKGNVIERNVNTGGPFISVAPGIREDNIIRNNWEEGDPLFVDSKSMDFSIRTGSPVYGKIGVEPVSFETIGVYKDNLRASWPVSRKKEDIGKYYMSGWKAINQIAKTQVPQKRVSKALEYTVHKTVRPPVIDGRLDREEWLGLDRTRGMVIEQYYTGEAKEGPKSYAWMMYDDKYLYVAALHEADPYKEDMPARLKNHLPVFEMSIESQHGSHSRSWWIDDMPTGPIYIFWGNAEGKAEYKNNFGMSHDRAQAIEKSIEYKTSIIDPEKLAWVSEMKIPFEKIGLKPSESEQQAFNIGVWKRGGWFTWVATGTNVWRVENAGFIKFEK